MRVASLRERSWLLYLIVAFSLLSGTLYALLMPLWEGFDEAFHYGYVQELSARNRIPSLRDASLSGEVWDSLLLVPVSHVVRRNIPELMTFDEYFRLPEGARRKLRERLENIAPAERYDFRELRPNYEGHQAPAAYLALAVADKTAASAPLLVRVRILRIGSVVFSILLTAGAAVTLCRQLDIRSPFWELALLLTFCSQMFYATVARISNDWLALPLLTWWLVSAIVACRKPGLRQTAVSAVLLACGLLTKVYFLAFVPLFLVTMAVSLVHKRIRPRIALLGIALVGLIAGPWYVRNVQANRAFTGMQEEAAGIGLTKVVHSAASVPWISSIGYMARASLWTGNNQFNTFSRLTLNTLLFLLGIGGCYYVGGLREHGVSAGDAVVLSAIGLFALAVAYDTVVAYINTNGASAGASPWYMQVLLVPVLCLIAKGLARGGRLARVVAVAQIALWTYVILATYIAKLIPQYGGYDPARVRASDLVNWYVHSGAQRNDILSMITLAPPRLLYSLLSAVCICGVAAATLVSRQLLHGTRTIHGGVAGRAKNGADGPGVR